MGSALLIVTFDDVNQGDQALETLKSWRDEHLIEVSDAVVLVKNEEGEIKVKETMDFSTRRGAIAGGSAGFVIGLVVGGPIGGAILGAAAGAFAGKKVDLGIPSETIEAVTESMNNASSAIALQVKKVKNKEMIAAAIRQSGGHLHELSISDTVELDVEEVMMRGGSAR